MKEPKQTEPKSDVDLRLATIRRDCLSLAVQDRKGDDPSIDTIELAEKMFNFVIGKRPPTITTTAKELEVILNSESDKKPEWYK